MTSHRTSLPRRELATFLFARTVANLNFRILYPFLPAIARGLGVSLAEVGHLVSVQGGIGLLSPLFGPLSDRHGRRRMMEISLLLLSLASALAFASGTYPIFLLAFAGFGISKALYDPALQAYIGDAISYAQRGRTIAITEMAWSFAWLLGVPLTGFLIEQVGWRAPWAVIAVLALGGAAATRMFLPPAPPDARPHGAAPPASWQMLLRRRSVVASLLTGAGMILALENVFIVYGAVLENRFQLAIGAIGLASILLGVAELVAEGGAAVWMDRIGKKRSVVLGLLAFAASLLLLPVASAQLATAVASFALVILCFEWTIVSFLPLMTEIAPDARATLLSMNIAAMGIGRIVAPLLGTGLYERAGSLLPNALLSAVVCVLSAALLWWGVDESD